MKDLKMEANFKIATKLGISFTLFIALASCDSEIETSDRISIHECRQNLEAIYEAIKCNSITNENKIGNIEDLVTSGCLKLPLAGRHAINPLMCPSAPGDASQLPKTTEDWLQQIKSSQNISYKLIRSGDRFESKKREPLVVEYSGDHLHGFHILYADGTIEFILRR